MVLYLGVLDLKAGADSLAIERFDRTENDLPLFTETLFSVIASGAPLTDHYSYGYDLLAQAIDTSAVEIVTDDGISGLFGPIDRDQAFVIHHHLRPFLLGRYPLATELVYDQMIRLNRHGRSGLFMTGVSPVDCALWDLKGKAWDKPIHSLLGGPTRPTVPAYASMLGYPVEPEAAGWSAEMGYHALPYEAVRSADDPDATLGAFLRSTYAAGFLVLRLAEPGDRDAEARPESDPTERE